jgi:ABC-type thiamine transport system substrate-binding protein
MKTKLSTLIFLLLSMVAQATPTYDKMTENDDGSVSFINPRFHVDGYEAFIEQSTNGETICQLFKYHKWLSSNIVRLKKGEVELVGLNTDGTVYQSNYLGVDQVACVYSEVVCSN